MGTPQSAVLPEASGHALFLTMDVGPAEADARGVRAALARLDALTREVGASSPEARLLSAVGLGDSFWDRCHPEGRPAKLRAFRALEDAGRSAPSTGADVFLHVRCDRADLNFELARRFRLAVGDCASPVEEIACFRYLDSRDMTGFVDGTENPEGEQRAKVALVGAEDEAFAAGAYVAVQRYVHNLGAWEALSVPEQEQIIARTKDDNVEFPAERKPETAHIKRVSIKEEGESLEILRHSMPYGSTSEHGLYFVAYCATPDNFDRMLERMVVTDGAGHHDHLLDYTRAVTGASFFVPSLEILATGAL